MGVAGILGSHSLATLMLARFGTREQQTRWLPDLADVSGHPRCWRRLLRSEHIRLTNREMQCGNCTNHSKCFLRHGINPFVPKRRAVRRVRGMARTRSAGRGPFSELPVEIRHEGNEALSAWRPSVRSRADMIGRLANALHVSPLELPGAVRDANKAQSR